MSQALQAQSAKLSAASLRDAIRQGEGAAIEFKSSFQKEVVETLTAFANTQGGAVLMGVSDAGQIVGVTFVAYGLAMTKEWIATAYGLAMTIASSLRAHHPRHCERSAAIHSLNSHN